MDTLVHAGGRLHLGATQSQFGEFVNLSQGENSRIETGKVEPPIWLIMYLLHYYPDLLPDTATDVEQLRAAVRQPVEKMDEAALWAVLKLSGS